MVFRAYFNVFLSWRLQSVKASRFSRTSFHFSFCISFLESKSALLHRNHMLDIISCCRSVLFQLLIGLTLYRTWSKGSSNAWPAVGKTANLGEACFYLDILPFQCLSFLPSSSPKPALIASWYIISGLCSNVILFSTLQIFSSRPANAMLLGTDRCLPDRSSL